MGLVLVLQLFFEGKRFSTPYREGWSWMVAGFLGLRDDQGWMLGLLCLCPPCLPFVQMKASHHAGHQVACWQSLTSFAVVQA